MNFISKKKLAKYEFLYRRGDAEKIAEQSKVERGTIYIALRSGRCSIELEESIDKFYNKRIEQLKKFIDAAENA